MSIQKVRIKEFKAVKNLNYDLNGQSILVLGENGLGKSSVLQFMEIALGKTKNIPPNAKGSGELVKLTNGVEYTYKVKFKQGKPIVTVINPEGMEDSRRSVLASLVGAMDFDIDGFIELSRTRAGRDKQVAIFKSFLPQELQDELNRLEGKVKVDYDERTDLNRLVKSLDALIKAHPLLNTIHFKEFEQVDLSQVFKELGEARKTNGLRTKAETQAEEAARRITELEVQIEQEKIKTGKAIAWLKENPEINVTELEKTIADATDKNSTYNESLKLKNNLKLHEELTEQSGELTALIDSSKEAIKDAIKDMDTPVEGLLYDMEGLTYNGFAVHPDTLSTAEIGYLGIQLKIAENPELGVLFIQNGQNYGTKRLKEIQALGCQIIMEQVERGQEELTIEIMAN